MDVMPWQAVLFISIPEAFLIILMGLTLTGIRPDLKRLGAVAVIQAVGSYFIRGLDFPYGVHILLQLTTMVLLTKVVLEYEWRMALPGVFLGFVIFAGVLDTLYFPLIVKYVVSIETILTNPLVRIAVSVPQQLAMLVIVWICRKYNLRIINLSSQ